MAATWADAPLAPDLYSLLTFMVTETSPF